MKDALVAGLIAVSFVDCIGFALVTVAADKMIATHTRALVLYHLPVTAR